MGSTERFLAERRIQKLTQEAAGLGYETPEQELRKEAVQPTWPNRMEYPNRRRLRCWTPWSIL